MILSLVALMIAANTVFADNDKPISVDKLPKTAKEFIAKYFPDIKVSYAKMDTDIFDKSYEVVFTNGNKVEFNSRGEWKDVDCKFTQVPEGIVPQQIKVYVNTNYTDTKIIEIDRDRRDYEVKLNNRLELKFDLKFNLIGIDS